MTTFTASEVVTKLRERFASGNDVPVPDVRLTRAEFDVIADRLEADEKAVPVMVVNHVSSAEHDLPIGMKLYAHPVPSDAERLAEALRSIGERLSSVLCDPFGEVVVRGSGGDRQVLTQALKELGALSAHSAQAQPPAQSKYAPPYPDQSDEWAVVPRVPTKAMIDACCKIKLDRLEALRDGHGASSGIVAAVQEEWAAMIAAAPRKRHDTINLLEDSTAQPQAARVPDIETMVNRFLSWRLPKPWNPDNGISYTRPNYAHEPAEHDWPTGTNLFDAHQAREMIEYMLAAQENPNG